MENTNYFGRICRFLGRITLFAGFILGIGISALLIINPFAGKDSSKVIADITGASTTSEGNPNAVSQAIASAVTQNQIISWVITGIIILAACIALLYLAKKYNDFLRKIIVKIAKLTKSPIHMVELGLTLIVWSIVLIMLFFGFPAASTVLIFPFILNVLFFLFGWISYGMPEYKV